MAKPTAKAEKRAALTQVKGGKAGGPSGAEVSHKPPVAQQQGKIARAASTQGPQAGRLAAAKSAMAWKKKKRQKKRGKESQFEKAPAQAEEY